MQLFSINTGYFKLDGGAMFGVVPKSMWNKLNPADENNLCNWALRSLLIKTDDRLILVDTGMGNKQDAKFFGHYHLNGNDSLESSLAQHGFSKNDITDVFHTHLHFDHCGGTIVRENDQLIAAFPNAQFWSNAKHWDWAVNPNERERASFLKENILPIQETGKLEFVPTPLSDFDANNLLGSSDFIKDISIRFVNGHTNSMMLPQINYKGRTIVYMADLLPSTAHIPLPYIMGYDMFPYTTLQEKKSFLKEAADNNYVLFFEHDPNNECCTVQETEKGIRVKEIFTLDSI
ncbi:MAG: MBL fold metallo-hydrolase [Sphingobacteriia bacterium]|jgi:glyoxylase-like metal-dependent hydrolase (beta-lactamase superfamily II)